jgi:archaellum biogenesis protein FlaJ (TadC family)
MRYLPDFTNAQLVQLCKTLNIYHNLGERWRDLDSEALQRLIRQRIGGRYFADSLNRFADLVEEFTGATIKPRTR